MQIYWSGILESHLDETHILVSLYPEIDCSSSFNKKIYSGIESLTLWTTSLKDYLVVVCFLWTAMPEPAPE